MCQKSNYNQPTTIPQPTQSQLLRLWRGRHRLLQYTYATTGYAPCKPCNYRTCSTQALPTTLAKPNSAKQKSPGYPPFLWGFPHYSTPFIHKTGTYPLQMYPFCTAKRTPLHRKRTTSQHQKDYISNKKEPFYAMYYCTRQAPTNVIRCV